MRADGVSILNLSAHNFRRNAFYFVGADRYRASYVTVWNVGVYGIYAEDGEHGVLDHDYVSGAADAAYYVGECRPCDALVSDVVATLSAVGYSGTNASDVVIRDSLWDRNGAGIVAEHVCERGAAAAGANDDRPQHGDRQRPRARSDQDGARGLRRDRHRRGRAATTTSSARTA